MACKALRPKERLHKNSLKNGGKQMMKKKLLVFTLIAALAIGTAACGDKAQTSDGETGGETAGSAGTAQAGSTGNGTGGGEETQESEPLKLTGLIIQFNQIPTKDGNFWTDMEKRFHVDYDVEWVPSASYQEKQNLVLSTGDFPEVIQLLTTTEPSVVKAVENGMFKDLTPYIESGKYENLSSSISAAAWMNSKIRGKSYVLPRSRGQYNVCTFLRGDWLDELNMEVPETIEELKDYYIGIKKLHPDSIPLALAVDINLYDIFVTPAFGPGMIIPAYTEDGSGIMHYTLTESYARTVEWFRELYEAGALASEFPIYQNTKNQDLFYTCKGGMAVYNAYHRCRLDQELQKVDPNAYVVPIFGVKGDDGIALSYDTGAMAGLAINAEVPDEKVEKILEFFNQTADPENYNYFTFGLEGLHWNMVDGYPAFTELGEKEVTASQYGPFTLCTDLYNKVDSPLAGAEYNNNMREQVKIVDELAAEIGAAPFDLFKIISSGSWSSWSSVYGQDFKSFVSNTITGKYSMDEFRAYQQEIINTPEVQASFAEFKASYDEFGLAEWKAPAAE